ncbi:MAG: hypothetical protein QW755_01095 [Nitrososphaerota archaeon]
MLSIEEIILSNIICFTITLIIIPIVIKISKRYGLMGIDVHKKDKPLIPKIGGVAIVSGVLISISIIEFFNNFKNSKILAFIFSSLIATIIGLIEDIKEIEPRLKTFLTLLIGIPFIILEAYTPYPILPFIGKVRLTIIYPYLVLLAFAVTSNTANMIDVLNGSLIISYLIIFGGSIIISYIVGSIEAIFISTLLISSMIAFLPFNIFPAKIFVGNCGSLFIGAAIASIAIIARTEVSLIVALMPQILNSFYILSSFKGLKSGKSIENRPIKIENNIIKASFDKNAPITIVRLITARVGMKENEVVYMIALLSLLSVFLSIITQIFLIK